MKVFANCFTCDKEYDASRWSNRYGVKCDEPGCGGYVISPSGKLKFRIEGEIVKPDPLLKVIQ